ncbi:MAG: hypothetical protein H6581_12085 [Bacteroidia bacterium]|nr:hypothetical protein [Bacteroidia bacterium]
MKSKALIAVILITLSTHLATFGQSPSANPTGLNAQGLSGDTVIINMVALDQPWMYNRMGAAQPTGMIYALQSDVVAKSPLKPIGPGNVRLRDQKRPRPIVLRANQGDILVINFKNLLRPFDPVNQVSIYPPFKVSQDTINPIYPATRMAGVHITGMELVGSISSDGSFAGANPNSLIAPGESITYTLFAKETGSYLISSGGALVGNGTMRGGTRANGLFGECNIQPPRAEWYRSQVTEPELFAATTGWVNGKTGKQLTLADLGVKGIPTPEKRQELYDKGYYPIINYDAVSPFRPGVPLLKMYTSRPAKGAPGHEVRTLMHTDLTAIITGPSKNVAPGDKPYNFPSAYSTLVPDMFPVYATPNQLQPYREFSIMYHEVPWAVEAFPAFYNANTADPVNNITGTAAGGFDQFAINYGTGGIAAEIYANRVGVGPMADCVDCAYEEFFLSSWAVGDPAMVVNIPANVAAEIENQDRKSLSQGNELLNNLMLSQANIIFDGTPVFGGEQIPTQQQIAADYAYYADDPSNVYHSYMNDHVKFRISHAGTGLTHVHHQHAAQWLHSPNSQVGHYLDSQTINPGATYTLNMVYDGSGNVNKTVGDKIFHCHFYPHFAQGMWAHWRIHDVLETGSVVAPKFSANVTPGAPPLPPSPPHGPLLKGTRALPDGEIWNGTPIPALVPIPNLPMAPIPGKIVINEGQVEVKDQTKNPGYPFFVAGVAGSRAPQPPLDFAQGDYTDINGKTGTGSLNGGLPRKVVIGGKVVFSNQTIYDWTKITDSLQAIHLPEEGTFFEKLAMDAHATRNHSTYLPDGTPATFILNGLKPQRGAPYADPGITLDGKGVEKADQSNVRIYKGANIQIDAVINKLGWHYPQTRPIVLWGDVASTVAGDRPPQPFFFRANSREIIEYWHTNLVPEYYEVDDYQVRTPTDVIGQHIHLVKFDVTSSDGAANGWNYEDGTLSPDMVRETIEHINEGGAWYKPDLKKYFAGSIKGMAGTPSGEKLVPHKPNPIWGQAPQGQNWVGAQTTIQRWYADPLYNNAMTHDRTIRTVFTHDHFGPSTHQQVGLYAGLLIEPENSQWFNSSTGDSLGSARPGKASRKVGVAYSVGANGVPSVSQLASVSDGGPTDWQAIIETPANQRTYREFMYEYQDNQQAYLAGSKAAADEYPHWTDTSTVAYFTKNVNTNYRGWIDTENAINPPGAPEIVSTGGRGILSMNYRNEPLPARVQGGPGNSPNSAYSFSSNETRGIDALNSQPTPGYIAPGTNKFIWAKQPISPGMLPGDPYTPLARAYTGDEVQVRTLVGAHVNPHYLNIHGLHWQFEPSFKNSGLRSTQTASLSEHFELNFFMPNTAGNANGLADYLVMTNADETGMQGGSWGLIRSYSQDQPDLKKLSTNQNPASNTQNCGCPPSAATNARKYDITAISIDQYQEFGENWGKLPYNERLRNFDTQAMVYVRTEELNDFRKGAGYRPQPLVLRASAGECVQVTLRNAVTPRFLVQQDSAGYANSTPPTVYAYQASTTAGLHVDLMSYDVSKNDGGAIGINGGNQLADNPGNIVQYEWYAGRWQKKGGNFTPQPVEFGAIPLSAPDPLLQYTSGLFGAMIIEPAGSYWVEDDNLYTDYTSASVYASEAAFKGGSKALFREFVVILQDNLLVYSEPRNATYGAVVNSAINYRSEPVGSRIFKDPTNLNTLDGSSNDNLNFNPENIYDLLTNAIVRSEPETPIFAASAGTPVRFRMIHTGGKGDGNVFDIHGHVWQELPYQASSTVLGVNDTSQWQGTREQLGALNSFDLLIASAGGTFKVPGDYVYLDWRAEPFTDGSWGLFRVTGGKDATVVYRVDVSGRDTNSIASLYGSSTVDPNTGKYPRSVSIKGSGGKSSTVNVNQANGQWLLTDAQLSIKQSVTVSATLADGSQGSSRTYSSDELYNYSREREKHGLRDVHFINDNVQNGINDGIKLRLPARSGGPNN